MNGKKVFGGRWQDYEGSAEEDSEEDFDEYPAEGEEYPEEGEKYPEEGEEYPEEGEEDSEIVTKPYPEEITTKEYSELHNEDSFEDPEIVTKPYPEEISTKKYSELHNEDHEKGYIEDNPDDPITGSIFRNKEKI